MRTFAHHLVAVSLLASAGSAAARPCAVTIPRAPADVRATVEAWVDREPACSVSLEVRIIPSEGALYVLARDERGRTYERIVPDAQSAGVLVASWMADDSMPSAPAAVALPGRIAFEAPGIPPLAEVPAIIAQGEPPAPSPSRWLAVEGMLGAGVGSGSVRGVRAWLDVLSLGNWSFGASLAVGQGGMSLTAVGLNSTSIGQLVETTDLKALGYAVRQIDLDHWHVRPAFALGAMNSTVHIADRNFPASVMPETRTKTSFMGELSFVVARDVGASWAIQGGLLLDVDPQWISVDSTDVDGIANVHRSMDLVLVFGVGRRL